MTEYRIHDANLGRLLDLVAKVNKRAPKLGVEPVAVTVGDIFLVPKPAPREHLSDPYRLVTVEGHAPKLNGWTFVATLDFLADDTGTGSVLLRVAPGETVPGSYRTATKACDHCKLARNRISTYVVRHEDGRTAQVGRNCLKDFLGHAEPEKLAEWLDGLLKIGAAADAAGEGDGGGWGSGASRVSLLTVLALTGASIDRTGWVSRTESRNRDTEATADAVAHELFHRHCPTHGKHVIVATPEHVAEAERALAWVATLPAEKNGSLSDYEHNIVTLGRLDVIGTKYLGVAASIIAVFRRAEERLRRRARLAEVSTHVGTVGKREVFEVTLLGTSVIDGNYGTTYLYKLADAAGNSLKYFSSRSLGLEEGRTYKLKATVKAHEEWKGVKETRLTRGVVEATVATAPLEGAA